MTNIYNGLLENMERALGHMQRHDTERVLEAMPKPLSGPKWLRALHNGNPQIAEWRQQQAESAGDENAPQIGAAQDIAQRVIAPVLARDTRTNFYTRSGGNLMAGLTDLWIQKDPFNQDELRQAHIVEYDLVNMEAVLMASEKMLHAIDEENKGRKRSKTSPIRMTDGYMRVVNGLVYEAFAEELETAGIEDAHSYIHPVRLSNGDEFRLVVIGLDDDQIAHANKVAQEKVQRFVAQLGLDAIPHLKHLKDVQKWNEIGNIDAIAADPQLFKAYQYGGSGIKIGAVALGAGQKTSEIEHELDMQLRACREERAAARGQLLQQAIDARKDETLPSPHFPLFNRGHKLAKNGFGTVLFGDHQSFVQAMKVIKQDEYRGYYQRPKVEALDFPYELKDERLQAYPYNNPDHYIDEFIGIIGSYVTLTHGVKKQLEHMLQEELKQPVAGSTPHTRLASVIMDATEITLEDSFGPGEMPDVLKARAQFAEKRELLRESLETFAGSWNPYESFDLTRKRILDKEADKLHLDAQQRATLFYAPLDLANARHEDGYCMSGRVKSALQIFQANDKELRQFSYIGLSSFAGINEVSTAFARSINDNIRHIAAEELKKRFGKKVMDFAYAVESGRLNVLTHGINKTDLVEVLSEIELRVEREINQQPMEHLLRRYRIFTQPLQHKVMIAKDEGSEDILRILDEVHAAQDKYGQETPLVFDYSTEGEVSARPLNEEELEARRGAIAEGKHLFLMERSKAMEMKVPEQVQSYLKAAGYVDEKEQLDLSKPLSQLPNPKHTHEHGVRTITAYVELLGNSPRLADQRKDELFRLVEVKKRSLYEPGKGYEVPIPVEAMPNLRTPEEAQATSQVAGNQTPPVLGRFTGNPRNQPAEKAPATAASKVKPFVPVSKAGWLRQLDKLEFEMLHKRNVPETLLQMITDGYLDVELSRKHNYTIHVHRRNKGYDREDVEAPRRRAAFFKHALEEHFGQDVVVTGLSDHAKGNRSIILRVRLKDEEKKNLNPKEQELVGFLDSLIAFKNHQQTHDPEIAQELAAQVQKYRTQLRAINLLRHYPDISIEAPRNQGGNFVIRLPQEPGERKKLWKDRCDNLKKEFRKLFSELAVELEVKEGDVPKTTRTGGSSLKERVKYQIRIESTPFSNEVLSYMASIQQPEQLRQNAYNGSHAGGGR